MEVLRKNMAKMEEDQIAVLKNTRLVKSSTGYVLWKAGAGLIVSKTNFEDLYTVNRLEDSVLHCTISESELTILKWMNKWKGLR